MPTRNQVCAWVAGFGLVVPSLALAQDRTEREIVDVIVREGPQARAINAGVEVVRREQSARLAYPNPSISYSREGAGFTEFFLVEQSLPVLGIRDALTRAGVAATEAAEAERDARLWTLRADAAATVTRLSAAEARRDAAAAYAQEVQRLVGILRTREREGEGSRFDRLRAEHELRDAQLIVTGTSIEASDARASLAAMLPDQFMVGHITSTQASPPAPAVDSLIARATSSRADLRALERSRSRAELESDVARRARFPGPVLVGGLKRSDSVSGREAGGTLGVSFLLPVLDSGGREAARWIAERERIQAARAAIEQQIRTEILRAADALTRRRAALEQSATTADDDLITIAVVAYREGEIGILELIDAARAAARAQSRSIDVRLEYRQAEIALERAVGDVLWP